MRVVGLVVVLAVVGAPASAEPLSEEQAAVWAGAKAVKIEVVDRSPSATVSKRSVPQIAKRALGLLGKKVAGKSRVTMRFDLAGTPDRGVYNGKGCDSGAGISGSLVVVFAGAGERSFPISGHRPPPLTVREDECDKPPWLDAVYAAAGVPDAVASFLASAGGDHAIEQMLWDTGPQRDRFVQPVTRVLDAMFADPAVAKRYVQTNTGPIGARAVEKIQITSGAEAVELLVPLVPSAGDVHVAAIERVATLLRTFRGRKPQDDHATLFAALVAGLADKSGPRRLRHARALIAGGRAVGANVPDAQTVIAIGPLLDDVDSRVRDGVLEALNKVPGSAWGGLGKDEWKRRASTCGDAVCPGDRRSP